MAGPHLTFEAKLGPVPQDQGRPLRHLRKARLLFPLLHAATRPPSPITKALCQPPPPFPLLPPPSHCCGPCAPALTSATGRATVTQSGEGERGPHAWPRPCSPSLGERARGSGERPIGAARCRQQYNPASCQPPPDAGNVLAGFVCPAPTDLVTSLPVAGRWTCSRPLESRSPAVQPFPSQSTAQGI